MLSGINSGYTTYGYGVDPNAANFYNNLRSVQQDITTGNSVSAFSGTTSPVGDYYVAPTATTEPAEEKSSIGAGTIIVGATIATIAGLALTGKLGKAAEAAKGLFKEGSALGKAKKAVVGAFKDDGIAKKAFDSVTGFFKKTTKEPPAATT
ncbi:MAG: hypothetical protein PHV68_08615 [Candidatus Gastranaerophilales bacterium]|nr:hypothetical protein [Candidatus Gastranaerophilales bacterium]